MTQTATSGEAEGGKGGKGGNGGNAGLNVPIASNNAIALYGGRDQRQLLSRWWQRRQRRQRHQRQRQKHQQQ